MVIWGSTGVAPTQAVEKKDNNHLKQGG